MPPQPLTTIYKEINSSKITTDIYLPPLSSNGESKSYPVLINIHGGAFMLGNSQMVSLDQIDDCLARGWIVIVPNHRLCPGIDVLTGPVTDVRDLLSWIYQGDLEAFLSRERLARYKVDTERVMAFGTSSGGFLALSLGYDVPRPPAAILDFYGPVHFTAPFWTSRLPHVLEKLPREGFRPEFLAKVYDEFPIPTTSGISLEGQPQATDLSRPRDAYALTQIANGTVLNAIYPRGVEVGSFCAIDPVEKIKQCKVFPPTFIVHGDSDRMVPTELSRVLFRVLNDLGIECGMVEVPGEDHTFAMGMRVGSQTWEVQRRGFDWLERIIG
ncbi:hypothetical protein BDV12DRAFT_207294 [Aspergillus spectabilis]